MPDDGSNVGHIEPQDAYDALVEGLKEGARETVCNDNGNGEQAPTAEREVDRMLREWRAEADAHPRLAHTLGDSVAALGHFARAFGRETSKTVLAHVARAWRGDREGRSRWVQAPRQAPSAALPERELGMTLALSAGLLVALLSAMPKQPPTIVRPANSIGCVSISALGSTRASPQPMFTQRPRA